MRLGRTCRASGVGEHLLPAVLRDHLRCHLVFDSSILENLGQEGERQAWVKTAGEPKGRRIAVNGTYIRRIIMPDYGSSIIGRQVPWQY